MEMHPFYLEILEEECKKAPDEPEPEPEPEGPEKKEPEQEPVIPFVDEPAIPF